MQVIATTGEGGRDVATPKNNRPHRRNPQRESTADGGDGLWEPGHGNSDQEFLRWRRQLELVANETTQYRSPLLEGSIRFQAKKVVHSVAPEAIGTPK